MTTRDRLSRDAAMRMLPSILGPPRVPETQGEWQSYTRTQGMLAGRLSRLPWPALIAVRLLAALVPRPRVEDLDLGNWKPTPEATERVLRWLASDDDAQDGV